MARRRLLLSLGLGVLSGCATATSPRAQLVLEVDQSQRVMLAQAPTKPSPYAPSPPVNGTVNQTGGGIGRQAEGQAEQPGVGSEALQPAVVGADPMTQPAAPAQTSFNAPPAMPAALPPADMTRLVDSTALLVQNTVSSATPAAEPMAHTPATATVVKPTPARAPLTLTKACFCRRIIGFGLYDPLPEDVPTFLGGTEGRPGERVLLYLEIGNFHTHHSKVNDLSLYETLLNGSLQIYPSGLARAPMAAEIQIPREARPSRSLRQDYFMRLEFNVPPGLSPGTYSLKVLLEDETPTDEAPTTRGSGPGRQAHCLLEFRVVEAR
jgi:hypothetical protein